MSLESFIKETIGKHPDLREEVMDMYYLYLSEVEEGGSENNERSLCFSSIRELVEEKESE